MSDDERTRRRLGDDTKSRIADLASGWAVDPPAAAPTPATATATPTPAPAPRTKPKTAPPPAPGSAERKALEANVVGVAAPRTPPTDSGAWTATDAVSGSIVAPGPPPARPKGTTQPPPIPPVPPKVAIDSRRTVPLGEFDGGSSTTLDPDKLRIAHGQATIKRDAASVVLGITEPALTQVKETPVELLLDESAHALRGDPTLTDPATAEFVRGDPTQAGRVDPSVARPAALHTRAARLRTVASLRRQRGLFGDVRYVKTALFGVRRARHELAELEATQTARQQGRRRYLVTLGRTAVTTEGFDHPALAPAREQLAAMEDERARHHAQVGAADQELQRVTRDREAAAKQSATDLAAVDAELAELAKRLEPLHKEQGALTRKAADLREAMRRADAAIAEATSALVAVKGGKKDAATLQAELATAKADRLAIQKDEPALAAELDALNPKIAALEAKRVEQTARRTELVTAEQNDQRRTEELLAAIGAKRKVMDRAAGDAETARDKVLFELGERLYVDRPESLAAQMAPVDTIDVDLGVADRRLMELREILASIDRWKLARGVAVLVLVVGALAAGAVWLTWLR